MQSQYVSLAGKKRQPESHQVLFFAHWQSMLCPLFGAGNSRDSDEQHFWSSTPGDSDMALLTLGNFDIEFGNKSGHEPWGK